MITLCSLPHLSARWRLRLFCRESNSEVLYSRRVASRTVNDFQRYFRPFSCTKSDTNWIKQYSPMLRSSPWTKTFRTKKRRKKLLVSSLRCLYLLRKWPTVIFHALLLCQKIETSDRVNRDNTLLYSAKFNLVKPSHADSKNVTQMEQKLSTTYGMLVF